MTDKKMERLLNDLIMPLIAPPEDPRADYKKGTRKEEEHELLWGTSGDKQKPKRADLPLRNRDKADL